MASWAKSFFRSTMEPLITKALVNTLKVPLGILTAFNLFGFMWPPQAQVNNGDTFHNIIIGSGVGSVIANRLTEDENCQVLLIEAGDNPSLESMVAGGFVALQNSYQDWNYLSEPEEASQSQSGNVFKLSSGKALGGGTGIGHFLYVRGTRHDFDSWAEYLKDSTWKYEDVLPYFIKTETLEDEEILNSPDGSYHGTDGPVILTREPKPLAAKYLKSFEEVGYPSVLDINGKSSNGYTQGMFIIGNGRRQSTAEAYLKPAMKRKNLHVLRKAKVTKILFDENKVATGVEFTLDNKEKVTVKAINEVIVCAGVYNTPQLLMLSGIGPKEDLEKLNIPVIADLPVGKDLQEHVGVALGIKMEFSLEISQLPQLTQLAFPVVVGAVSLDKSKDYPDYQTTNLILTHDTVYMLAGCGILFGYNNKICQQFEDGTRWHNHMFSLVAAVHPESRGEVTLRSADPNDPPIIRENFYSNKNDLVNMVRYIEDFIRVLNSTHFRDVNAELVKFKIDGCDAEFGTSEYWAHYAKAMSTTLYHGTSTCAMGQVVDSELNVYGVKKLRIVGDSVMPNVTRANPMATSLMIAEKISDVIKKKYTITPTVNGNGSAGAKKHFLGIF